MKRIFGSAAIAGSVLLGACGMFGPMGEQVRDQPQKTVYKSADEADEESPNLAPVQKVPGESR